MDREIKSWQEIDFGKLYRIPIIAVYWNPKDYPGECVARLYDGGIPTCYIMRTKSVNEMNEKIRTQTRMAYIGRYMTDGPELAGTWM